MTIKYSLFLRLHYKVILKNCFSIQQKLELIKNKQGKMLFLYSLFFKIRIHYTFIRIMLVVKGKSKDQILKAS